MRLAVWSPLPPSPSGIADYVAEALPELGRHAEVVAVVEDPGAVAAAPVRCAAPGDEGAVDLHVYHLGNSPAHAYLYRAALEQPGVVVLHEWSLHHLVLCETVERGDRAAYLREMRRAHGENGTFVGRQVARALGGDLLPALYPLNDRVLENALGVVALTREVAGRARHRLRQRPVLHLPHHLALPLDPLPSRAEARRRLGLPAGALLVTAPGLATPAKRLDAVIGAVARLRGRFPELELVVAGGVDPRLPLERWAREAGLGDALRVTGRLSLEDFALHLCACDVVSALRFPSHGEISGALVRSLGVGRPALVSGSTPAADEFPEGVVAPVDPGRDEGAELEALLGALLERPELRDAMGRLARQHVLERAGIPATVSALVGFLEDVAGRREELLRAVSRRRAPAGSLLELLSDEVRWGASELGLAGVDLGVEPLLAALGAARRPR